MGFWKDLAGGLTSGIGGIVGGITGGLFGAGDTNRTNSANAMINQRQIDFQREQNNIMRSREDNAIQRKAADLKEIGINPIMSGLSGGGGSPAQSGGSAPSQISMQKSEVGKIISDTSQKIMSGVEYKKTQAEIDKIKAEKDKIKTDTVGSEIHNEIDNWDFSSTKGDIDGRRYKDSNTFGQIYDLINHLITQSTGSEKASLKELALKWKNNSKDITPKIETNEEFKENLKEAIDMGVNKLKSTPLVDLFIKKKHPGKNQKEWVRKHTEWDRNKRNPKNYKNPLQ